MINKDRLETAILAQVQEQILTGDNVRRYIELATEQAEAPQEPTPEERGVSLAIADVEARLRRWEETLERGLLPLEDAAHRITELRQERAALLKTKGILERKSGRPKVVAIPSSLMNAYVSEMQKRLRAKNIGNKREFLREILKEIRVKRNEVTLSYKIPLTPRKPPNKSGGGQFFTVL